VEQSVSGAGENGGAAEILAAGSITAFVSGVVVNVIGDEQIQPAITIVVKESR